MGVKDIKTPLFIVIERSTEVDGIEKFTEVYRSEPSSGSSFKEVTINTFQLCHSNLDAPLLIKLYDLQQAVPVLVAAVTRSVRQLLENHEI